MIHLTLKGSPYEMGLQHGKSLRPLVDGIVKCLSRDYLFNNAFITEDAKQIESSLEKSAPELLDELSGIAEGAEIDFRRLLYTNLKYLTYCTVIAFTDSEDGPILGKNLDYPEYAFQVLFTVIPDKGSTFTHIGCAGSVSSFGGMNAQGLSMGHSVVFLKEKINDVSKGLPISFLRRLSLQYCSDTTEAIQYIASMPSLYVGDNIVFLDKNGNAQMIEKSPLSHRIRLPENKCIHSTNTFVHQDHAELVDYKEEPIRRYEYIHELLNVKIDSLNTSAMESALSNNLGNYPVCRKTTQLSYITYPQRLTMKVADGYPSINGFNDFTIKL